MDPMPQVEVEDRDLESLDDLWAGGLGQAYHQFRHLTADSRVALAAALVETGIGLQGIGSHVAAHHALLLGDLCLARASRLLADAADQRLQVAFARAVERVSSEAADQRPVTSIRSLLSEAIGIP